MHHTVRQANVVQLCYAINCSKRLHCSTAGSAPRVISCALLWCGKAVEPAHTPAHASQRRLLAAMPISCLSQTWLRLHMCRASNTQHTSHVQLGPHLQVLAEVQHAGALPDLCRMTGWLGILLHAAVVGPARGITCRVLVRVLHTSMLSKPWLQCMWLAAKHNIITHSYRLNWKYLSRRCTSACWQDLGCNAYYCLPHTPYQRNAIVSPGRTCLGATSSGCTMLAGPWLHCEYLVATNKHTYTADAIKRGPPGSTCPGAAPCWPSRVPCRRT
jgi:hypothetical protein